MHTGYADLTITIMCSLLYTFCLHLYLINIHVFDRPDSRLCGLFIVTSTIGQNVVSHFNSLTRHSV